MSYRCHFYYIFSIDFFRFHHETHKIDSVSVKASHHILCMLFIFAYRIILKLNLYLYIKCKAKKKEDEGKNSPGEGRKKCLIKFFVINNIETHKVSVE